jgi:hypothetical protein
MLGTVPPSMPPRGTTRRPSYPGIPGALSYPFPVDPPQLRLDPPSTNRRSTKEQCLHVRSPQDPGSFTVPSLTWPWYPGDGRPFLEHVATATFTAPIEPSPLRHRPRVSSTPLPSLDPIKGKAGDSPREGKNEGRKPQDTPQLLRSISQAIYSFPFY